jgi:hypothetical protein
MADDKNDTRYLANTTLLFQLNGVISGNGSIINNFSSGKSSTIIVLLLLLILAASSEVVPIAHGVMKTHWGRATRRQYNLQTY